MNTTKLSKNAIRKKKRYNKISQLEKDLIAKEREFIKAGLKSNMGHLQDIAKYHNAKNRL